MWFPAETLISKVAGVLLVCLLAACAAEPVPPEPAGAVSRRVGFLAEALWEVTTGPEVLLPTPGTSLGAGHGVAAVFFASPCGHAEVLLADPKSQQGASGPCPDVSRPATFVNPLGDVVFIGPNGDVWWLGVPRGAVIAHPFNGNRVVTRVPTKGRVLAACSTDGRTVVYADSLDPGKLHLQAIERPETRQSIPLPEELAELAPAEWAAVQLGGAPNESCVLIAPRADRFVVIPPDSAAWSAPFHEPVPPAPPTRRWEWLQRKLWGPPRAGAPGPLDATSFNGGVAILYAGATAEAGRLVDLYNRAGKYSQTMILSQQAVRIASTGAQLLTLSHRDKRWRIAAYWFPGDTTDRQMVDSIIAPRLDEFLTVPSHSPVPPP